MIECAFLTVPIVADASSIRHWIMHVSQWSKLQKRDSVVHVSDRNAWRYPIMKPPKHEHCPARELPDSLT